MGCTDTGRFHGWWWSEGFEHRSMGNIVPKHGPGHGFWCLHQDIKTHELLAFFQTSLFFLGQKCHMEPTKCFSCIILVNLVNILRLTPSTRPCRYSWSLPSLLGLFFIEGKDFFVHRRFRWCHRNLFKFWNLNSPCKNRAKKPGNIPSQTRKKWAFHNSPRNAWAPLQLMLIEGLEDVSRFFAPGANQTRKSTQKSLGGGTSRH